LRNVTLFTDARKAKTDKKGKKVTDGKEADVTATTIMKKNEEA